MKNYWQPIKENLDKRSQRDRIILLAVALLIILVIWYFIFEKSISSKISALDTQIKTQQTTASSLTKQQQIIATEAKGATDPALVQQKNDLQQRLNAVERTLAPLKNKVITVKALPSLIKGMMAAAEKLSLNEFTVNLTPKASPDELDKTKQTVGAARNVAGSLVGVTAPVASAVAKAGGSISTLPGTTVPANASPPPRTPATIKPEQGALPPALTGVANALIGAAPVVQLETLTIKYQGSYFNTIRYLQRLKQLPWYFSFDNLSYQVAEYPTAMVNLQVNVIRMEGNNNG